MRVGLVSQDSEALEDLDGWEGKVQSRGYEVREDEYMTLASVAQDTFISSGATATNVAAAMRERKKSSNRVTRVTALWSGSSAAPMSRSKADSMDSSSGKAWGIDNCQ